MDGAGCYVCVEIHNMEQPAASHSRSSDNEVSLDKTSLCAFFVYISWTQQDTGLTCDFQRAVGMEEQTPEAFMMAQSRTIEED